jgi:hypothetical protein
MKISFWKRIVLRLKGWRKPGSAPKDGTMILVLETPNGEHWNVLPAAWFPPGTFTVGWWGTCPIIERNTYTRIAIGTIYAWKPMPKPIKLWT